MIVTAWNNGAHKRDGSGYGFRLSIADRDAYFKQEWKSIFLEFVGEENPVEIAIDESVFWSDSGKEVHCKELGKWLRKSGLAPWARGNPPVFVITPMEENHFKVERSTGKIGKLK